MFEGNTYYLKSSKNIISTLQNAFKSPFVPSFLISNQEQKSMFSFVIKQL